jgi:hypothetical protein
MIAPSYLLFIGLILMCLVDVGLALNLQEGYGTYYALAGNQMLRPLVGNFAAGVLDNLGALNPSAGGVSMLSFTMTFILGIEFVRRNRAALGGSRSFRARMGLVMASIAQLIFEGHQPTVANVGLTYDLLDASGGLQGWAEIVTDPERWDVFAVALGVGGATAETIAQI